MKSPNKSSSYVKRVSLNCGLGGCKAPERPVPISLPGAIVPRIRKLPNVPSCCAKHGRSRSRTYVGQE
jgi:hypothetical protein